MVRAYALSLGSFTGLNQIRRFPPRFRFFSRSPAQSQRALLHSGDRGRHLRTTMATPPASSPQANDYNLSAPDRALLLWLRRSRSDDLRGLPR